MTQGDFRSAFEGLVSGDLPPSQTSFIARQIVGRDQARVRILTAFCLLLWLLGTAGMLLLVLGLKKFHQKAVT